MVKYILVIYLCSVSTQTCNNGSILPFEYNDHYDCAVAGYDFSKKTMMEMDRDLINKDSLAIKFECRPLPIL